MNANVAAPTLKGISFKSAKDFFAYLNTAARCWGTEPAASRVFRGEGGAGWLLISRAWREPRDTHLERSAKAFPSGDVRWIS